MMMFQIADFFFFAVCFEHSVGHDYKSRGLVDNGILIDCSSMNGIEVDEANRMVHVGTGATYKDILGAINRETYGRYTAISGYALADSTKCNTFSSRFNL